MADEQTQIATATAPATSSPPPLNQLVVKWRAKFPKAYDNIDDATLTKKILAKYPVYSPLAVPGAQSASKPSTPAELRPSTGFERVGERIKQNVYAIPNALSGNTAEYQSGVTNPKAVAEAAAMRRESNAGARRMVGLDAEPIMGSKALGQAAAISTIVPRTVYDLGKQYTHDPSALVGDLVTLLPELAEMNFKAPANKVWQPSESAPRPTLLDKESQAKYTAALDKANADYQADATAYHKKLTDAFGEAKREHTENMAKYDADAAKEQAKVAAKNDKARSEWIEKSRNYEKARTEAESQAQKAHTLAQGAKNNVKQLFGNLKETYRAGRKALDERWGAWNGAVEGVKIDPKDAFDAVEAAKVQSLRGAPQSVPVLNNLLKELGVQEFIEGEDGALTAAPGAAELPIETARTHYSAIVEKLRQPDLPGNIRYGLEGVRDALDNLIMEGAKSKSTPGRDLVSEYHGLKNDENMFRTDWTDRRSPLAAALGKLDPNYLEPLIVGRGNEFIARQLGRWRQFGGNPDLVTGTLRMVDEAKDVAKAKVKMPPEPGPEPVPAKLPKKGEPPSLPERKDVVLAKRDQPELRAVERPTARPKAGPVSKAAAKVIGKLGGSAGGAVIGHPMVGWAVGGELMPQLLDRIIGTADGAKGVSPVTAADMAALEPVEKAGIQNGIANRLIVAAERGDPLPPLQKFKDVLTRDQMQRVMQAAMKSKAGAVGGDGSGSSPSSATNSGTQ